MSVRLRRTNDALRPVLVVDGVERPLEPTETHWLIEDMHDITRAVMLEQAAFGGAPLGRIGLLSRLRRWWST